MKLYEFQRSRSFIDLGASHSDLIVSNFFSSITAWPIEAEFHMESPWVGGRKADTNCSGHLTKRVAMSIYG